MERLVARGLIAPDETSMTAVATVDGDKTLNWLYNWIEKSLVLLPFGRVLLDSLTAPNSLPSTTGPTPLDT